MRRFVPAEWPPLVGDEEDERHQRARRRWHAARRRWCVAHDVELGDLMRAGEVEARYEHLRAGGP